ncbi:DUF7220 family protein [Mycoplasmopsis arginini]|uniref:DUF7220 family protein n=1 Tax=Mycoplasmopsis arginini TaxID=2094 RepID=UPI003FA5E089
MQTRLESLIEAAINVVLGYMIALGAQLLIFPWFNIHIPMSSNIAIGIIFTLVSLVRSYALRRFFNWFHSWSSYKVNQARSTTYISFGKLC